jgi:tRNA-specific 2-thiouridylase
MASSRSKVLVALSGGVDSSVAAALLLEAGYDCLGVFMVTNEHSRHAQTDAEQVAHSLGMKLTVLDVRTAFEGIQRYFCDEYRRGRTPNPCVVCNRVIKFGRLRDFATERGAEFLATGHYATVALPGGRPGLYAGVDAAKDQSYALAMVDRDVLPHVLLPLGKQSKAQSRTIARRLHLGTETKDDSQEICFIPDNDYIRVLETREPALVREGRIVDSSGRILGTHQGVHRFTIGQRRGLRVAMGRPFYVTHLDAATNTVVLGPSEEVLHHGLTATDVNWLIDRPSAPFEAIVKIRYNDRGKAATVIPAQDCVQIRFHEPNKAITPGQLAVFYVPDDGTNRVAGAGWIDKVAD